MSADSDQFDFFVSYARKDNVDGWITRLTKELLAERRRFTGHDPTRGLKPFFDKQEICSLDVVSGVHGLGAVGETGLAFAYARARAWPSGRFPVTCEGKTSRRARPRDLLRIRDEERKTRETCFTAITIGLPARLAISKLASVGVTTHGRAHERKTTLRLRSSL